MSIGYIIDNERGVVLAPFLVEAKWKKVNLQRLESLPSERSSLPDHVVIDPSYSANDEYYSHLRDCVESNPDTRFWVVVGSSFRESDFIRHLGKTGNVEYLTVSNDGPERLLGLLD